MKHEWHSHTLQKEHIRHIGCHGIPVRAENKEKYIIIIGIFILERYILICIHFNNPV